tara:strand:- start:357 stop:494 length:138 start_codon:yes stop_codon:yes gene_type:complete
MKFTSATPFIFTQERQRSGLVVMMAAKAEELLNDDWDQMLEESKN